MAVYMTLTARCLLGLVFVVSALSKVRSRSSFRAFSAWLTGLPVLSADARKVLAPLIPLGEAAIVVLLVLPWTLRAGLVLAAAIMAAFTVGTIIVVRRKVQAPCQCFGTSTVPLRNLHAGRNAVLCGVAVVASFTAYAASGSARPGGVGLSIGIATVMALFAFFLDDLADLIWES